MPKDSLKLADTRSVKLPLRIDAELKREAKKKATTIGQLIRTIVVEHYDRQGSSDEKVRARE